MVRTLNIREWQFNFLDTADAFSACPLKAQIYDRDWSESCFPPPAFPREELNERNPAIRRSGHSIPCFPRRSTGPPVAVPLATD
jgi:hypothetical protein